MRLARIVTDKQRPDAASGVTFISLEDETGTIKIVIWVRVQEHFRNKILTSQRLIVAGTV